jgi:hypothetical protein
MDNPVPPKKQKSRGLPRTTLASLPIAQPNHGKIAQTHPHTAPEQPGHSGKLAAKDGYERR